MVNSRLLFVIISSVILSLTFPLTLDAFQVIDSMEKGNTLYREGEYEKAIEEYIK